MLGDKIYDHKWNKTTFIKWCTKCYEGSEQEDSCLGSGKSLQIMCMTSGPGIGEESHAQEKGRMENGINSGLAGIRA